MAQIESHYPDGDKRPNLFDLWRQHHFDIGTLSLATNLSESTILAMLRYQPIRQKDAEKVLSKLGSQLHHDLTLETVHVPLIK